MANFFDMKRTSTNQKHFTFKEIQITLKHLKRCCISIMRQEMYFKTIMKCHFLTSD